MKLTIVRHGETIENRNDVSQGQTYGTLSDLGQEQAKKLAIRLKDEQFDIIYCSDLDRTKKTLTSILKFHPNTKVAYEKAIRERSKGIFEGKHHDHIRKFYKEHTDDLFEIVPPKGESLNQLIDRVNTFYDLIIEKHAGQNVLMVTHGEVIVTILQRVLKFNKYKAKPYVPENTAVSIIEIEDDGNHKARIVNCVEHL